MGIIKIFEKYDKINKVRAICGVFEDLYEDVNGVINVRCFISLDDGYGDIKKRDLYEVGKFLNDPSNISKIDTSNLMVEVSFSKMDNLVDFLYDLFKVLDMDLKYEYSRDNRDDPYVVKLDGKFEKYILNMLNIVDANVELEIYDYQWGGSSCFYNVKLGLNLFDIEY